MSKHRAATGRHRGRRRAGRRRVPVASIAALAAGTLVAVPVFSVNGEPDARVAAEGEVTSPPSPTPTSPSASPTPEPPDGEVEVERDAGRRRQPPSRESARVPEQGAGAFAVAPAPAAGTADDATTYRVEVETGLPFAPADVARFVEATLADQRSWATRHRLERVDGRADLRIVLASPETADALCAPLDTDGRLSCRNGSDVVLNAWRWAFGADSYAGELAAYRRYVVNHETGHALGYPHVGCPGQGEPAPVMLQQTKGLDGCEANPWPARTDLAADH